MRERVFVGTVFKGRPLLGSRVVFAFVAADLQVGS